MIRSITSDDREYSLPRNIFGKLKDDIHKRINVPHNAMLDSRNAKNFLTFLGKMRKNFIIMNAIKVLIHKQLKYLRLYKPIKSNLQYVR